MEELAAMVEAWCEVIGPVVPMDRLNDCYLYAMQHRESTFPLASTELLTAWRIINAEESSKRRQEPRCYVCKGKGREMIYDPKTQTEFEKECPSCIGKVPTDLVAVK